MDQKKSKSGAWERIKSYGLMLYDTYNQFSEDKCLRMSASLAYYTIFSIGPFIIILIWLLGFFYQTLLQGDEDVHLQVMLELNELFGAQVADLLDNAIAKISLDDRSSIGVLIGAGVLIATSTKIFLDIQTSINTIFAIKPTPNKSWVKLIMNRLISFSMILALSILMVLSLMLSSILKAATGYIQQYLPDLNLDMMGILSTGIGFSVALALFLCILGFLHDARLRFKDIFVGSLFTALLFMIGKYLISLYLSSNATASAYGAAGTIVVFMAWIYYSAAMLYFGVEFTKTYAIRFGNGIKPAPQATRTQQIEVEVDDQDIFPKEQKES